MVAQQESVRKGKSLEKRKEEKRREKWFEGKERLFMLLCDGVFHTILSSHFHFTMPPLFFPHSNHTTIHTTPTHYIPHKHACVLLSFFLCV